MLKLQLFKYSNRFPICLVRRLVLIFQKASDIVDKPLIFTKRYKNVPELTDQICDVCQRMTTKQSPSSIVLETSVRYTATRIETK